jgi:hypothetical protein
MPSSVCELGGGTVKTPALELNEMPLRNGGVT